TRKELEAQGDDELVAELLAADPGSGEHIDLSNRRRVIRAVEILRLTGETPSGRAQTAEAARLRRYDPEVRFEAVGLDPGDALDDRIDRRLEEMRRGGLVEEVQNLRGRLGKTARAAVGYKEVLSYLKGDFGLDEAFEGAARSTKRLARRQRTWFQRDPRIRWIPWIEDADRRAERALEVLG
ncbi:MAG: tRNA (adenosine(37)-N6)-dimethylallyltransferase, partial [Acidimicrobiia bacterium]